MSMQRRRRRRILQIGKGIIKEKGVGICLVAINFKYKVILIKCMVFSLGSRLLVSVLSDLIIHVYTTQ